MAREKNWEVANKIRKMIEANPKGIWMSEIARKMKMTVPMVAYYVYGRPSRDGTKTYGGYWKDEVKTARKEGSNKYLVLKL